MFVYSDIGSPQDPDGSASPRSSEEAMGGDA